MKLQTITQICKSKHLPDATCKKSPEPPRCRGCKVGCNKFDCLILSSVECRSRRMEAEEANHDR